MFYLSQRREMAPTQNVEFKKIRLNLGFSPSRAIAEYRSPQLLKFDKIRVLDSFCLSSRWTLSPMLPSSVLPYSLTPFFFHPFPSNFPFQFFSLFLSSPPFLSLHPSAFLPLTSLLSRFLPPPSRFLLFLLSLPFSPFLYYPFSSFLLSSPFPSV